MSASEIIEKLKVLPTEQKKAVKAFLDEVLTDKQRDLFDDFTLLGSDAESADVTFAEAAQGEVVRHAR